MKIPKEIVADKIGKNRLANGKFAKGNCANPDGRPRKPEIELLREALIKAKQEKGMGFLEHFVFQAYKNPNIAIALAKKLLPDQIKGEGFGSTTAVYSLIREIRESQALDKTPLELDNGHGVYKGRTRPNTPDKEIPLQTASGDNL